MHPATQKPQIKQLTFTNNMLPAIIILTLTSLTNAQINGEFWWLNDKLAEFKGTKPAPAKYEDVSEFETDETDKVVFNDSNDTNNEKNGGTGKWNFRFQDHKQMWPNERVAKTTNLKVTTARPNVNSGDELDFKFPDSDNFIWKEVLTSNKNNSSNTMPISTNNSSNNVSTKNKTVLITDKITFKVYKEQTTQVQNICTYLKKGECKRRRGIIYLKYDRPINLKVTADAQLLCCILPLPTDKPSKIYFVDDFPVNQRLKRSTNKGDSITPALKQRNALINRRFPNHNRKVQKSPVATAQTKVTHKIVTPEDDYVDPYANIKNTNFKNQYASDNPYDGSGTKYEYGSQDYVDDYMVELPRPGLVGLYSDHGPGSIWTYASGSTHSPTPYGTMNTDDEEETDPGYSTFDPRLVDRLAIGNTKPKRKPIKFTTDDSDEFTYDLQSQAVSYQAHPDFHVFQGFKLLNLFRNTSRFYSKNGRRTTTTESIRHSECDKIRPVLVDSSVSEETNYDDLYEVNEEIFSDCGKAVKDPLKECEHDKQSGEADIGSHPWLALAVLTKSPQSILCYASLVHPRAAVTAADCVYGKTSPGEVTVLAGVWDLEDDSSVRPQQRMAMFYIDPEYKPGNLAHNLAMLHWNRPLQLSVNVRPACVADPHVGDECKFVGWGGYDQAIRARPRWQRASILTPRQCNSRLSSTSRRVTLPSDGFCASVDSRSSVTGIGGPLTCNVGGRHSVVGVAVWRESALIMLPAHEWTARAIASLHIQ